MNNTKEVILTYDGLKRHEEELEYLKSVKRREIAERIKVALSFGDISENSEYDDAKNEQAQLELKISQLETTLKNAKVIDDDDVNTDVVSLGSKVKLLDIEYKDELEYQILGSTEADPAKNKISNESPVGLALMGKKKGQVVEVQAPAGIIKFKILNIYK